MPKCKHGRHIPSFILLFLANEPAYGLTLLNKMEQNLPHNRADTAAIYRSLQELEKAGAVVSHWDTSEAGPARKWYKITELGLIKLDEHKKEVEKTMSNLQYFLDSFEQLNRKK